MGCYFTPSNTIPNLLYSVLSCTAHPESYLACMIVYNTKFYNCISPGYSYTLSFPVNFRNRFNTYVSLSMTMVLPLFQNFFLDYLIREGIQNRECTGKFFV